jgi:hypothetical protein
MKQNTRSYKIMYDISLIDLIMHGTYRYIHQLELINTIMRYFAYFPK